MTQEWRGRGTVPDRLVMSIPGLQVHDAQHLAEQAVELARQMAPKSSGISSSHFTPIWGTGFYGIRWAEDYVWYQEMGIRPFTMRSLAGKAQPLDEEVLTPIGWQKMSAIEPGDLVIGSNGEPTSVLSIFPQGILRCYRVTFSDGTSVRCSADHLWTARRSRSGSGGWETRTTEYLASRIRAGWRVPLVQPIQMEQLDLPLHPYLVGVFLGDGCLTASSPTFSAGSSAVPAEVQRLVDDLEVRKSSGSNHSWTVTAGPRGTRSNPLGESLRKAGINGLYSWEKFIPAVYMAGDPQNRESLLQGLMDTDGSCSAEGYLRFHSCSRMLAENLADLVRGLGGHASVSSEREGRRGHRPMHSVSFRVPESISPFRADLDRKSRYSGSCYDGKGIVSIEDDGEAEMQCILVDADDALYVTSGYTLTHNTIPMWIKDPTGSVRRENPRAETRTSAAGVTEVKIFRRAAPIGSRKTVTRRQNGRLIRTTVPASYPGAPGRIAVRESRAHTTDGRVGGAIARGNVGVRWRHPGLARRSFIRQGLVLAAHYSGLQPGTVRDSNGRFR